MSNPNARLAGGGWRVESPQERADRNLGELLQELRVAGIGVQVLFGFLLALPFTVRFSQLSSAQRDLYVTDVVLSSLATALLVGPVAYHRIIFRQHQREHLVRIANIMAISGLAAVALAVSTAVALIVNYVVPGAVAVVISTCVYVLFAALWFAIPLSRRGRRGRYGATPH